MYLLFIKITDVKCKHSLVILTTCIASFLTEASSQRPNTVPQNRYGLSVITKVADYQRTVTSDSNNRMVPVQHFITPFLADWKYATADNFTHTVLYQAPEAFVRLPVARALQQVQQELAAQGLSLLFYDAYRPYAITEKMWEIIPDERYAANPAKGSGHNRGIAVDVTLASLATGIPIAMPTGFDNFTEKAHHSYMQLDSAVIVHRALLKTVMVKYGFSPLATEWWHYSYTGKETGSKYHILNLSFKELSK